MKSKYIRLYFWQKIILLLTGSILTLSLGLAFVTRHSMTHAGKQIGAEGEDILSAQAETFLSKLVREEAVNLDLRLAQTRAAVAYGAVFLSENLNTHSGDSGFLDKALKALLERSGKTAAAYFVSPDGKVRSYPARESEQDFPKNLIEEPFFPKFSDLHEIFGEVQWSQVHPNPFTVTYELVIDAVAPVLHEGVIQAYLGISLSLTQLTAQFNFHQPIRGSYCFVMDDNYQLVGAPPHARTDLSSPEAYMPRGIISLSKTENAGLDTVLRDMAMGGSFLKKVTIKDQVKYLTCHPLTHINWRLGLVVPVAMATAASRQLVGVVENVTRQAMLQMILWSLGLLIISLIAGALMAKLMVSPLHLMAGVAEKISDGDFGRRVDVASRDEVGNLARAFNVMADHVETMFADLNLRNRELEHEIAERVKAEDALRKLNEELENRVSQRTADLAKANTEILFLNECLKSENLRLNAELDVARRLQEMILPRAEELRNIEELDIVGFMKPADEVGGDYYDIIRCGGSIKISIGDVTGHGLESGVLMLMTQTAVRTLLISGESDPKRFLNILNSVIYGNVRRMQVDKSLTLSLLDYKDRQVKISGQHEQMIVMRQGGSLELVDTFDLGFPIGMDDNISAFVNEVAVSLNPGDSIVLYSDGITEAENMSKEFYGLERLCEVIRQNRDQCAEGIKEAVVGDIRQFIGEQKLYDDLTLVVMKQQ